MECASALGVVPFDDLKSLGYTSMVFWHTTDFGLQFELITLFMLREKLGKLTETKRPMFLNVSQKYI